MLGPIGVIAKATISWAATRLWIGNRPGFRTNSPQNGVRTHGASTLFGVVRLQQKATLIGPEIIEGADDVLKVHKSDIAWFLGG